MGRDVSIVSTHEKSQNVTIRSIIDADEGKSLPTGKVHFGLKPAKVFLFCTDTEERIRFLIFYPIFAVRRYSWAAERIEVSYGKTKYESLALSIAGIPVSGCFYDLSSYRRIRVLLLKRVTILHPRPFTA